MPSPRESGAPDRLILDCRGLFCPIPVIRVAQAMKKAARGDIVELLADDPGVPGDMEAWSKGTGNPVLSFQRESGGGFKFRVQKAGAPENS